MTITNKNSFTFTLMTCALLALLTLPTLGVAGQQIQLASLENTFNSHVVFSDIAENYGDINDEEDDQIDHDGDAKSDLRSQSNPGLQLMVAMADGLEADITDGGGYNDNQDEE